MVRVAKASILDVLEFRVASMVAGDHRHRVLTAQLGTVGLKAYIKA